MAGQRILEPVSQAGQSNVRVAIPRGLRQRYHPMPIDFNTEVSLSEDNSIFDFFRDMKPVLSIAFGDARTHGTRWLPETIMSSASPVPDRSAPIRILWWP